MHRAKGLSLILGAVAFAASAVVLGGLAAPAHATPAYAQATGKACGFCHVSPGGGGKLTKNGEKFKANGHKL